MLFMLIISVSGQTPLICYDWRSRSVVFAKSVDNYFIFLFDFFKRDSFYFKGLDAKKEVVGEETEGPGVFFGHLRGQGCHFSALLYG
jgi:hypothetical protein